LAPRITIQNLYFLNERAKVVKEMNNLELPVISIREPSITKANNYAVFITIQKSTDLLRDNERYLLVPSYYKPQPEKSHSIIITPDIFLISF
jgi:hypothetical protein